MLSFFFFQTDNLSVYVLNYLNIDLLLFSLFKHYQLGIRAYIDINNNNIEKWTFS